MIEVCLYSTDVIVDDIHHDYFDHHHHIEHVPQPLPPPPPSTTLPPPPLPPLEEPEEEEEQPRVKKYSYFYLSRSLWYIPLYFTVWFTFYVTYLILLSIGRHKVILFTFRIMKHVEIIDLSLFYRLICQITSQIIIEGVFEIYHITKPSIRSTRSRILLCRKLQILRRNIHNLNVKKSIKMYDKFQSKVFFSLNRNSFSFHSFFFSFNSLKIVTKHSNDALIRRIVKSKCEHSSKCCRYSPH